MTVSLGGVALPEDIDWPDEYTAWKVGQVLRTSLTGALIVQEAVRQAGRSITLASTDLGNGRYVALVTLDVLNALRSLEEVGGGASLQLVLIGSGEVERTFTVRFNRAGGAAIEARPIKQVVPVESSDYFFITLRLITV